MHTFLTYALLPSGWFPIRQSLTDTSVMTVAEARDASRDRARALYTSHVTKTIILEFR